MAVTQAPRPKTRERILDAAMDLFADEGFNGTTITEIERRVGLTPGTGSLYRHFPSKEVLLRAAVDWEVARCRVELGVARASLTETDDPAGRRAHEFEQLLRDFGRFHRLFRLMLNEGDRVPELRRAIWNALQRPAKADPDDTEVVSAIAMAALGGYHLFSTMQGRPFNNVAQDRFIRVLIGLISQHDEVPAETTP